MVDIICTYHILRDDAALAVRILDNLAKVSHFDLIIMGLSSMHKDGKFELVPCCTPPPPLSLAVF
jgi:hypothetical protein